MDAVADAGDLEAEDEDVESLTNRMATQREPEDDWEAFQRDRAWHYTTYPKDWTVDYPEDDAGVLGFVRTGPAGFDFAISVRFPHGDYAEVLARLQAFSTRGVS